MRKPALPHVYTAAEVAAHIGCNERRLRSLARSIGACREIGKTLVLTEGDVQAILEATRSCPSSSTSAVPDGWQIVPKIATEEMVEAAWEGCNRIGEHDCITLFGDAYAKALAAAPPAPASDVAALKKTDHDR